MIDQYEDVILLTSGGALYAAKTRPRDNIGCEVISDPRIHVCCHSERASKSGGRPSSS